MDANPGNWGRIYVECNNWAAQVWALGGGSICWVMRLLIYSFCIGRWFDCVCWPMPALLLVCVVCCVCTLLILSSLSYSSMLNSTVPRTRLLGYIILPWATESWNMSTGNWALYLRVSVAPGSTRAGSAQPITSGKDVVKLSQSTVAKETRRSQQKSEAC